MLYCPKYSVGSVVTVNGYSEEGKIVDFEAVLRPRKQVDAEEPYIYKVTYFIEISGYGVKKIPENQVADVKRIAPEVTSDLDRFLADTLLLAYDKSERVGNTIRELLKEK